MVAQDKPRCLIAILSCHKNRPIQQTLRDTWVGDVDWADVRFFLGNPPAAPDADEAFLDVPDDYHNLPRKTYGMLAWAVSRDYTHVFKADTDTYVAQDRLRDSGFDGHDYTGNAWNHKDVYLLGGPGYWLNRRAMEAILSLSADEFARLHDAEDVAVGRALKQKGINAVIDDRYRDRFSDSQPLQINDLITTHRCNRVQLLMAYATYTERFPVALMDYFRQKFGDMPEATILSLIKNESAPVVNRIGLAKLLKERGSRLADDPDATAMLKRARQ